MSFTDLKNSNEQITAMSIAGIDQGFGTFKISSGETNIKFPSIVGNPVSEFTKDAAIASFDELLNSLAIIYNGQTYYIGHNAIINTRNGKISLRQNKATDEQNKIKTMTALALLTNENQYEAEFDIIAGLPVLEYKNQKDKLYELFYNQGRPFEFVMKYGNSLVPKKIKCRNIKIVSQGEGAFYSYILDNTGNIITTRADNVSDTVMIVDIGYKTTDIVTMENGRYIEILSDQINNGVSQMHQEVLRLIMEEFNIKKELKDIDNIVRNNSLFYSTKTYDMTNIIKKASEPFADSIIEALYTITNGDLGNIQMILLTGGGAELTFNYIKDNLKEIVKVDKLYNSEFSNSQGYFKYGMLLKNQSML